VKDRYEIMHFGKTIGGPLVRGAVEQPSKAYDAGKALQQQGAQQVQIHDKQTGKIYDLAAFAQEHRLS